MKAMLFAAGLGTRLWPLTGQTPKALVKLNGIPLLGHALHQLEKWGVVEVMINVHHYPDAIIEWLKNHPSNLRISFSDERDQLLDTGGGLLKARDFFRGDESFLACNVDVLSTVDMSDVQHIHNSRDALATLVVRDRPTSRYFLFDRQNQLCGWMNRETGEEIRARSSDHPVKPLAFSGIQILSPEIFNYITESGKFPITHLYLRLAKDHRIVGYTDRSDFWIDLGKPGQIAEAEEWLQTQSL
ncbi:MAG TPA: nucleotidyltransferase family protein [Prolixibacteraceae bacterium]|nr:nucleotidyltransferase family protein [Prolixibacteraceae bacterium]